MTDASLKRSFPPIVDADTRLLILGSLPGDRSLAEARYYANPRNQFWRLIGAVIESDVAALDYEARLRVLLAAGVGLWDVVGTARRSGSLDAAIRDHQPNALLPLARRLPNLRAIAFNGGTSARLGMKALGDGTAFALVPLPSSSPAYTLSFDAKLALWLPLRAYLGDGTEA
jgi:hypoxanthine-DNA glycosylase